MDYTLLFIYLFLLQRYTWKLWNYLLSRFACLLKFFCMEWNTCTITASNSTFSVNRGIAISVLRVLLSHLMISLDFSNRQIWKQFQKERAEKAGGRWYSINTCCLAFCLVSCLRKLVLSLKQTSSVLKPSNYSMMCLLYS